MPDVFSATLWDVYVEKKLDRQCAYTHRHECHSGSGSTGKEHGALDVYQCCPYISSNES